MRIRRRRQWNCPSSELVSPAWTRLEESLKRSLPSSFISFASDARRARESHNFDQRRRLSPRKGRPVFGDKRPAAGEPGGGRRRGGRRVRKDRRIAPVVGAIPMRRGVRARVKQSKYRQIMRVTCGGAASPCG